MVAKDSVWQKLLDYLSSAGVAWVRFLDRLRKAQVAEGTQNEDADADSGNASPGADEVRSIPDELPVLPLKNTVVFPLTVVPLLVGKPRSIKLVDEVVLQDRLVALVALRRPGSLRRPIRWRNPSNLRRLHAIPRDCSVSWSRWHPICLKRW